MEQVGTTTAQARHPVRLVVNDDLRRNRLTVFFRLLLAIPHLIWFILWGIVALLAGIANWFVALVLGRVPEGLRNFAAFALRYEQQTAAYAYLLTDRYPSFNVSVSE